MKVLHCIDFSVYFIDFTPKISKILISQKWPNDYATCDILIYQPNKPMSELSDKVVNQLGCLAIRQLAKANKTANPPAGGG